MILKASEGNSLGLVQRFDLDPDTPVSLETDFDGLESCLKDPNLPVALFPKKTHLPEGLEMTLNASIIHSCTAAYLADIEFPALR